MTAFKATREGCVRVLLAAAGLWCDAFGATARGCPPAHACHGRSRAGSQSGVCGGARCLPGACVRLHGSACRTRACGRAGMRPSAAECGRLEACLAHVRRKGGHASTCVAMDSILHLSLPVSAFLSRTPCPSLPLSSMEVRHLAVGAIARQRSRAWGGVSFFLAALSLMVLLPGCRFSHPPSHMQCLLHGGRARG